MPRTLAVIVFDDVEVLDFCGPFEVFSVTETLFPGTFGQVLLVAEEARPVRTRGNMHVRPHHTLADCPAPDIFLIPGGQGTRAVMNHEPLLDWVRASAERAELVLSVCTGSLVLAKAGLLDGLGTTTHHAAIDLLRRVAPRSAVSEGGRFIDNGKVVCSAGVAAGIDMSLHVVSRLLGEDSARRVADYIEYPWTPGGDAK